MTAKAVVTDGLYHIFSVCSSRTQKKHRFRQKKAYVLLSLCKFEEIPQNGAKYGKAFLPMAVSLIREQYGCRDVYTSVHDDNTHAVHLYTSFGFEKTDEQDANEWFYILRG